MGVHRDTKRLLINAAVAIVVAAFIGRSFEQAAMALICFLLIGFFVMLTDNFIKDSRLYREAGQKESVSEKKFPDTLTIIKLHQESLPDSKSRDGKWHVERN